MKKLLFLFSLVFSLALVNAQTQKGSKFLEVGTSFTPSTVSSTGISFSTSDKLNTFNVGAEGGYFVAKDFAVKAGLGYGDVSYDGTNLGSTFSYKVGVKYYAGSKIPLGVDFNGADVKGASQNPSYVGLSGGYAWFVGNRVSFEPNIRYDISTNDTFKNVFSAGLGINLFFR